MYGKYDKSVFKFFEKEKNIYDSLNQYKPYI